MRCCCLQVKCSWSSEFHNAFNNVYTNKTNTGSLKGKNKCRPFVLRCVVNIGKQEGERIWVLN